MAVTHRNEYKTLNQVFVRMYRIEGVGSYYRGFVATILGVIPYAGCSFFTFETLKEFMAREFGFLNSVTQLKRAFFGNNYLGCSLYLP